MPKRTVRLLDKLVALGLSDTVFRSLHHMGVSITEHRTYCANRVASFKGPNNPAVCHRLEHMHSEIRERGLTGPVADDLWQQLAQSALSRYPLSGTSTAIGAAPHLPRPDRVPDTDLGVTRQNRLDDTILGSFMRSFMGYGNLDADFWFIGMEEGGGGNVSEVARRLSCWDQRGRRALEDLRGFHEAFGEHRWFAHRKLQPTWSRLIRVLLCATQRPHDQDAVRAYQVDNLGRESGETTLLELLPLPSPSADQWQYRDWSRIPELSSREAYRDALLKPRLGSLNRLLIECRPRAVVFYGQTYRPYWKALAAKAGQLDVHQIAGFQIELGANAGTTYVICAHPASRGISDTYFNAVGRKLRQVIK